MQEGGRRSREGDTGMEAEALKTEKGSRRGGMQAALETGNDRKEILPQSLWKECSPADTLMLAR